MVNFLFVRHGKTEYNEKHLLQGRKDILFSELGRIEARQTSKALESYSIDEIYTSPLKRAIETASIINGDRKIPLVIFDALIEMNYGDLKGKLAYKAKIGLRRDKYFTRFPHGENYFEVALRVYPFLQSIEKKYEGQDKTVLLVSHMGVYRVIRSYFTNMTNDEFSSCRVKNCEIVVLPKKEY